LWPCWKAENATPSGDECPTLTTFQNQSLELVGHQDLEAGEIISFMPDAIHQVETLGPEPALTFQLYGDTQPKSRYQFDPETFTAKPF